MSIDFIIIHHNKFKHSDFRIDKKAAYVNYDKIKMCSSQNFIYKLQDLQKNFYYEKR